MTIYNNVFGGESTPPSEYGYQTLSISANTTLNWPYNSTGGTNVSKLTNLTATVDLLTITLPDATQVSTGEDFLIRNVGLYAVTIHSAAGTTVATIDPGAAKYFYLVDNTTVDGVYGVVAYGVGTSSVDAGTLVGYGLMAIGATLNQAHDVVTESSATVTLADTYRSKLILFNGGTTTCNLPQATITANNFFFLARNGGSGVVTITPFAGDTVDGLSSMQLQPGESLLMFCSGASWFSVGYGRSVIYNFTQLVKDISAGGTITLSSVEASNKLLTFVGSPSGAVSVVVPNAVAVYYILNSLTTPQDVTVKTAAGTGAVVAQGQRVIAICNSTDVVSAQSVVATSSISLIDGTALIPALSFASKTNTGIYKYGSQGVGISSNGAEVAHFDASGSSIQGPAVINGLGYATTPTTGDNSTKLATTAYVQTTVGAGVVGAANTIREEQTATAGQTVFTLANTYRVGINSLAVFINGVRQFAPAYTETDTTHVTFASGLTLGDSVLFEMGIITSGSTVAAASVVFSPIGGNSATNVQTAIANVVPDHTGKQRGSVLATDGTIKYWDSPPIGSILHLAMFNAIF